MVKLDRDIEGAGFFPQLATRAVHRLVGDQEIKASLVQVEAAFDRGSMFRHLTILILTGSSFIQVHIDEADNHSAVVTSAVHSIRAIRGVSVQEVFADPTDSEEISEITISVDMASQRRSDIESLRCDDPTCEADHGFQARTYPDDVTIRISQLGDGARACADAQILIDALTQVVSNERF